jgi:hypothetical protein
MTVGIVALLAVVAIASVIFALRQPAITNSGSVPPVPVVTDSVDPPATAAGQTPGPTTSPTPAATSSTAPAVPLFLDASQSPELFRATPGQCGIVSPVLEVSRDAGQSWVGSTFGTLELGQIFSVDVVDADQTDIVAAILPDCQLSQISTYTAGQYWESYPERVADAVYVDPADSTRIMLRSNDVATPCSSVAQVVEEGDTVAVNCPEGVFVATSNAADTSWRPVLGEQAMTIDIDTSTGDIDAVVMQRATCTGPAVAVFDAEAESAVEETYTCLPIMSTGPTALSVDGPTMHVWSQDGFFTSTDSGSSWSQVN